MTSKWELIDRDAGIYRAKYQVTGTTPYCMAVRLTEGLTLIYSPGPELESELPSICSSDSNLLLLAPNLGHNLGIRPWLDAHPGAKVFAPEALHKRLRHKRGVENIQALPQLEPLLPDHVKLHIVPENKFHEVWISVDAGNKTYWMIGDAFLNFENVEANFILKFLLAIYGIKPGLRLHKMFRLALKDKQAFREWALPLFDNDRQHILLPCHREIYDAPDCRNRMVQIIQQS